MDCSRFITPSTFALSVSYGRFQHSPTCAWAPRWKITAWSPKDLRILSVWRIACLSVRSARWIVAFFWT